MKSREHLVTILLLAGLTGTFVAAVNLPGRRAEASMKHEITRAEGEIARGPQALARYKAEHAELDRRLRYLADSADAFTPADPHELLGRISRLAGSSRLAVKRLEPEPARPRASYVEYPFRLEYRGDVPSLAAFLGGLEADRRLFAVEELSIKPPADPASPESLEGTLRFAVFAEREDAADFAEEGDSAAGG